MVSLQNAWGTTCVLRQPQVRHSIKLRLPHAVSAGLFTRRLFPADLLMLRFFPADLWVLRLRALVRRLQGG
jgi:hypothetical protein